jgi:hypothetical protein
MADKISANQIEGLQLFTDKINSLSAFVASQATKSIT